jgi:hypothetical protein
VTTPACPASQRRNWNRQEIAKWLVELCREGKRFLAGIDHAFSFPVAYFDRHGLSTWPAFLDDFCQYWQTDRDHCYVEEFRKDNPRTGTDKEFRLTERWTSSAKSVFLFDVQGSVAKSTHAGIPWLRYIRQQTGGELHFWPFDGWDVPDGMSVVAEVYPSLFRHRYAQKSGAAKRTQDQHDAYAVARWLEETTRHGFLCRYLSLPLTDEERKLAEREGWILGVA